MPLRSKFCIVVLGNHEDSVWSKSGRFTPVLRANSLRFLGSLAAEQHCKLKQGNVKNTFCNSNFSPEEVTIVCSPSGDLSAANKELWLLRKTGYGLCCIPKHWYNKVVSIFPSLGLRPNAYNPCVFSGFIHNPNNPDDSPNLFRSQLVSILITLYNSPPVTRS